VWPLLELTTGWPGPADLEWLYLPSPILLLESLLVTPLVLGMFTFGLGWAMGWCRCVGRLDGFWLANPLSLLAGTVLYAFLSDDFRSEIEYWGHWMWLSQFVLASPIYACLFRRGSDVRLSERAA